MNMSYCKFENTSQDLNQCMDELLARLENPGSVDFGEVNLDGYEEEDCDDEYTSNMSEYEKNGMLSILQNVMAIVDAADGIDNLRQAIHS